MNKPELVDLMRQILTIPVNRILPMKDQPRKYFNPTKIKKLSASLTKAGQKVPIIVYMIEGNPNYDYGLVDGERRLRAKKKAGAKNIVAIVINADDLDDLFEVSAVANFGREDHTPLEIAYALQRVRENRIQKDGRCTEGDLAEMFAQSITWVSHHLLLLNLNEEVQKMMDPSLPREKRLTRTAAVQISRMPHPKQAALATRILKERLDLNSVRMHVREELMAQGQGVEVIFRGRPVDRYISIKRIARSFATNLGFYLGLPPQELRNAFSGQTNEEISNFQEILIEARKNLDILEGIASTTGRRLRA